jgi:hypothetical protein
MNVDAFSAELFADRNSTSAHEGFVPCSTNLYVLDENTRIDMSQTYSYAWWECCIVVGVSHS